MRDAQQIFTQQMKTDLHDITGEYGTKCKFWLFSSLMVYHLTHTLKNLFLLIGKSGNQHMKFTWIIREYILANSPDNNT